MIPRILIIDDLFGNFVRDRRNLCRQFCLIDVAGDDGTPISIPDAVAEAVFCSGQIRQGSLVRNDIPSTIATIRKGWTGDHLERWALVLLDLRFASGKIERDGEPEGLPEDDSFGLRILEVIGTQFPDLPVVVLSARERAEVLEDCRKLGALDFIQRNPLNAKETLRGKLFEHGLVQDRRGLIVGKSIPLLKALRSARRSATGKGNILLLGETGAGKELFARYIHDMSPKAKGPYIVFHPFGTAETLQEDELFGHVKGAFYGAVTDREGLFEMATGGTLLIDEIADIGDGLQNKLLRPLESQFVKRQGSNKEIAVDLQVVLATNKDLEEYARTKRFKFDLLNRIKAYSITIPPLTEMKEDIPLIAERLLEILCAEHHARWPRKILPEAMDLLKTHSWPDNVRGIRNVLERAVKNNKDIELVVASDIDFDRNPVADTPQTVVAVNDTNRYVPGMGEIEDLVETILNFKFPVDYGKLSGKLPSLRAAITKLMVGYLSAAIEVTKKKKPGQLENSEINITGAASCVMGKQLTAPIAGDVVKRILQSDAETLEGLLKENSNLNLVYHKVLKWRPKNAGTHKGVVENVDSDRKAFVVKGEKEEMIFSWTDKTKVLEGEKELSAADLRQGLGVIVKFKKEENNLVAQKITFVVPRRPKN